MDVWIISLLTAIGGAVVALLGREYIDWYKRPRFKVNFYERNRQKPYISNYHNIEFSGLNHEYRNKFFRLAVRNVGRRPAMSCQAKLIINEPSNSDKVVLQWSQRAPQLYRDDRISDNYEKIYSPITLNINDEETIDVMQLNYSFSTAPDTDHSPEIHNTVESVSFNKLILQPKTTYQGIVTVYSSNTSPKAFKFKVHWDGTVEGFNSAFTKN